MELKLTVSYQPRIITNPVRYDSKMNNTLTDNEKFTYDSLFWNEYRDRFYLQSDILDASLEWHIRDLIEPVVDTNVIDMDTYQVMSIDCQFDKNSYAVQFEATIHFDLRRNVDSDDLYIHKNRLTDLITKWLDNDGIYDNHAFISAGNEDLYADFGNVTVRYKILVERDDVDVMVEVRK